MRTMVIMLIGALLTLVACAPASATLPASTQVPTATATPTARFTTSDLIVTPDTVKSGETATVGVTVTNNGGEQGTYTLVVKLHDGTIVGTKDVTLAGGAKQNVTLDISLNSAGTHMIMVDKLFHNMVVQAAPAPAQTQPTPAPTPTPTPMPTPTPTPTPMPTPTPTTPSPSPTLPAAFTVTDLGIDQTMPEPGNNVTVSVKVTNTGGQQGTYTLVVKVDGITAKTQDVTLAGGASQAVNMTIVAGKVGTYTISIGPLEINMYVMFM